MKEANLDAQEQLYNIDNDVPTPIKMGKRVFMVKDLKQSIANRISLLNVKREKLLSLDGSNIESSTKENGKITSKVLSLAICGNPIKAFFLHAFLWRYIYHSFSYKETSEALYGIFSKLQLGFFFQNLALIEEMNTLTKKLTQKEAKLYRQELQSEQKQTS